MYQTFSEEQVVSFGMEMYARGRARFELEAERCALLVIDMQDEFVAPNRTPFWVPEATRQVPRMRMLIEACRRVDVPVVFTLFSDSHQFLDRPFVAPHMPNRLPELETPHDDWFQGSRIWHELEPRADEVIIKKPSYGAFFETPLQTILHNLGKDTVVITGTMTNYCCGMTARQAYERGFKVVFCSDLTATDDPQMQEMELRVQRRGFSLVMSADAIRDRLTASSVSCAPGEACRSGGTDHRP
jgi:nicotinamidase-related amidase